MAKKSLLYSRRRRSQLRVFSFSSLFRGKSRLPCFWLIVEGNQDGGSLEFDEFRLRVSSIYFFSKETVNCSINFMIKIIRCFAIYCNLTSPEKIESFPSLRFFFFFFPIRKFNHKEEGYSYTGRLVEWTLLRSRLWRNRCTPVSRWPFVIATKVSAQVFKLCSIMNNNRVLM